MLRLAALLADRGDVKAAARYRTAAENMLRALAVGCLATPGHGGTQQGPQLDSILRNGTVAAPQGSHSTGTIFGDYYFLDALALLAEEAGVDVAAASLNYTAGGSGGGSSSGSTSGAGEW